MPPLSGPDLCTPQADLDAALQPYVGPEGLTSPTEAHVVVGTP
jgi:hypothetical protein